LFSGYKKFVFLEKTNLDLIMLKFIVVSDSMTPLIPVGSELIIEKINDEHELKKFDILLFKQDGKLTCHYYWHQNKIYDPGTVTTRSLKDGSFDSPFDRKKILGVVKNFKIGFCLKFKILLRDKFV
jgi:signal peptidase I